MAVYGSISYWNERYTNEEEQFDWHQKWYGVKHIFTELDIKNDAKILNVGCGTSKFSEEMLDSGYTDITNIDASSACIKKMKEIYKDKPNLKYMLMNVCDMKEFKNAEFDLIIDKACLDSIVCSEDSLKYIEEMLSEVSRILKSEGTFVVISHAQPTYRLGYLQKQDYKWNVTIKTVKRPMLGIVTAPIDDNLHYVYICTKGNTKTQQ
ncbi:methyltransferase, putative [Plasmodium malariae]|uniref:Methyltransferase, putative n=1 Tax=Plasmodium malariae TaxID=5858 RepID=A0A1C3L1G6_PLAMA|nr:methyltransferase, putative [Plasmodium malariae]SBT80384.1 methyltransferase, putative [Plasmodium malariae]SCO94020.1 methyltransferase, putative [Plasmodium malariae]